MTTALPKLIALTGHAGTGKDTVRFILEGMGFSGYAFADPIRHMLRNMLASNGIDQKYIDGRSHKEAIIPELGVSYRQMAQTLGTEWGRKLQSDFWLRMAGAYIDDFAKLNGEPVPFVVSDVRFVNEANWVRERGGVIWRIKRYGAEPVRGHVSEREVDSIRYNDVIFNNSTIAELKDTVAGLLGVSA